MAKVPGFLSWPPAFSLALLPSSKCPGTDQHESVAPAKNLTESAVIRLEGSMETKSEHHATGSLSFPEGCSWAAPLSCQSPREPLGWAEKDLHHIQPGPELASVYCALGDLRPLGNLLPSKSPPSLECCICVEQDPHHGASPGSCSLPAVWRQQPASVGLEREGKGAEEKWGGRRGQAGGMVRAVPAGQQFYMPPCQAGCPIP